jgi:hypothetical protein
MFGCAATEALGQPLDRFIPVRLRATHHAHVRAFGSAGVTNRAMGKLGDLTALRAALLATGCLRPIPKVSIRAASMPRSTRACLMALARFMDSTSL